ncbi:MAG TPA: CRTAC1 family protein [Candidatus Methanoperedens sp.]|nr:CRTAC1 family protein [Candidatus Methanoperedens sp.]
MAKLKSLVIVSLCLAGALCLAGQAAALSFTDVTASSGADDKGRGKGVAFADIDGDGDYDLYVSNKGGANVLYRNDSTPGNITFTDITASAGDNLGDVGFAMGSAFADVDNDGRPDLFIAKGGQREVEANRLLRNESTPGRIRFVDISVEAGINTKDFTYQGAFADYDNDGRLDLFMANYGVGVKNRLFRNDSTPGRVKFTEVSAQAGVAAPGWSWAATWADVDGDGFQDLYVVRGRYPAGEPNLMYRNNHDGTFTEIGRETGLNDPNWGLGATWADTDNDGDFDLFLSNYVGENKLFRNEGNWKFTDVSKVARLNNPGWGKGPTFADVDHDGDLDLYEGDCKLANQLYLNDGKGVFTDVVERFPALKNEGVRTKGTAFTDLDGDGDMDLYVVNWAVPNRVYRNDQNDRGFLKVRLTGTISNRMAIGSLARVYDTGFAEDQKHLRGVRELRTATGFCAQEAPELHFGVPAGGTYDVVVNFPSGVKVVRRGVQAGQLLSIEEPNAVARK